MANAQETALKPYDPPLFRTVSGAEPPALPEGTTVRLVADSNFAPFSFLSNSGALAGLSVELAFAACEQAKLRCSIEARPYGEIMEALSRGEADGVIAGPRLDEANLAVARMTRPYFRIMARFAVKRGAEILSADSQGLSGRRIAVVKDTVHANWLAASYGGSEIVPFDDWAAAGAALKAGEVDALFGDNLAVIYWVTGETSASCCELLDSAFSDFDSFSRNLAFLVRRDRPDLRAAFDYGLDMAQASGATSRIIRTYVPLNPW
ncbi:transporter substrate-binding domain-containing protein [Aestuariivirga sp.]|uniref:transporter substrate-binding domain-containing protein n=1 Tax=Aestuariivirga sp. TaxID=2650926 RepID=UPI0035943E8F